MPPPPHPLAEETAAIAPTRILTARRGAPPFGRPTPRWLPECRRALGRLIARSPLPEMIFRQRSRKSLTVIAYHRIAALPDARNPFDDDVVSATPEEFTRELRFFQRHLDVISLTELLAGTEDPCLLPERPAVITFDDGYRDNYEVALPLLREMKLPACFFVCTSLIDQERIPWWDQVACCFKHSQIPRIRSPFGAEDRPYAADPAQRRRSTRRFLQNLTRCPWSAVAPQVEYLKRATGVDPAEYVTRPLFMTWQDVRSMEAAGMAVGSHTRTHPVLGQIDDPLVLRDEIGGSYADLQHALGHAPLAFAYPVGSEEAMQLQADAEIAHAGFRLSFSYQHGLAIPARGRSMRVPRIHAEFGEDHDAFRLGMALAPRIGCALPTAALALSHVPEGAVGG
jgi:peptidoglycan/xylan/chitin deacetylase (PgdA/CDA1 family)